MPWDVPRGERSRRGGVEDDGTGEVTGPVGIETLQGRPLERDPMHPHQVDQRVERIVDDGRARGEHLRDQTLRGVAEDPDQRRGLAPTRSGRAGTPSPGSSRSTPARPRAASARLRGRARSTSRSRGTRSGGPPAHPPEGGRPGRLRPIARPPRCSPRTRLGPRRAPRSRSGSGPPTPRWRSRAPPRRRPRPRSAVPASATTAVARVTGGRSSSSRNTSVVVPDRDSASSSG